MSCSRSQDQLGVEMGFKPREFGSGTWVPGSVLLGSTGYCLREAKRWETLVSPQIIQTVNNTLTDD